jgi:chromosome segregation ATPase
MNHLRSTKCMLIAIAVSAGVAHAQDYSQSYPNSAVYEIYSKQQIEERRAEELEQSAIAEKDRLDKARRDAEAEIAEHKYRIEGIKMRQDKATQELDAVSTDLATIKEQVSVVQTEHKQTEENAQATLDYLAAVQKELVTKQSQLNEETQQLTVMKKRAVDSIYAKGVEMERMKVEVAKAQTRIEDLRAQAADLGAREMQVRTEWMQNKLTVAEFNRQKAEAMAQLQETNKSLTKAQSDLTNSRKELAAAEAGKRHLQNEIADKMAKYEREIAAANRARINAEAERIRVDSETQKIREYAARIKEKRDQVMNEKEDAEGLVMQSSLALEGARTDLTQAAESENKNAYSKMRREAQSRGIAAASKAYKMVDGARPFVMSGKCDGYRSPASTDVSGSYAKGSKIFARPAGADWVEVLNGSDGKPSYLNSKCGSFEN